MKPFANLSNTQLEDALKSLQSDQGVGSADSALSREQSAEELQRLIKGLQIRQIELEMQNRELLLTNQELEISRNRFVELYDFAPVGFVTFDDNGFIQDINLTGAGLLEKERSFLLGKPFRLFVAKPDSQHFLDHFWKCRHSKQKVTSELSLMVQDDKTLQVQLVTMPIHETGTKPTWYYTVINDITERRQTEKLVLKSQLQLAGIIETALGGIITVDEHQRIVLFNHASKQLFGCSTAEALGKPIARFIPDRFRQELEDHVRRLEQTQGTDWWLEKLGTIFGLRTNGEEFPIEASISQIVVEGEKFFTIIFRENTDRLQAEQARRWLYEQLEVEQARLEAVLRQLPAGVLMVEAPSGNIILANDLVPYHLHHPVTQSSIIEQYRENRGIHPDGRPYAVAEYPLVRSITTGETVVNEDLIYLGDNGTTATYSVSSTPIYDKVGRLVGGLAVFYDITERKHLEEKLREQAALLDHAQEAIFVCNLEGCVLYWNQSAERIYGWTAEEVLGKQIRDFLFSAQAPHYVEAHRVLFEKGEWMGELSQLTKDRQEIIVESRLTLVTDENGHPKSILGTHIEITEKKRFEAQFLRAQRMESVGTLASGIAHDLNNSLTPMTVFVSLLRKKLAGDEDQSMFHVIEASLSHSVDMVRQVLSFVQGTEGKQVPFQLKYVINEIKNILKQTFPKSIEVETAISKNLWLMAGDSTQIQQVLMNLCINARDAMPGGGKLMITCENRVVDETYPRINLEARSGSFVVISITDTGKGIAPEHIHKIFEPFFTTKEVGKGTGLGLSTTLAIVKSHQGFITVKSKSLKGTRFEVFLPRVETPDVEQLQENTAEFYFGHGEMILVVDDELMVREITREALQASGYQVILAGDGLEALALYAKHQDQIKVTLIDMVMPNLDGSATTKALEKLNPQVKLILTSGLKAPGDIIEINHPTVKAFLRKPYTAEDLLGAVCEALNAS